MNPNTISFDDLEDFDSAGTGGPAPSHEAVAAPRPAIVKPTGLYVEKCPKCGGSGRYRGASSHGHACFKCNGAGTLTFKSSKETRQKATQGSRDRKAAKGEASIAKFEATHPDFAAWWTDSNFAFAVSMREAVRKYGNLTDAQFNAAGRCIEKDREYKARKLAEAAEREVARESAPEINSLRIRELLYRGKDKGIGKPTVRLAGPTMAFKFSLAPDSGMNAGAVYVNLKDGDYLGKIVNGKFLKAMACSDAQEKEILAACENMESSAIAYGQRYGICSCCGKELTNRLSIELGIGPICRAKFFA